MERIKRNGRMSAMVRVLMASPNRIFTLNHFCAMFDAAKSTISEDIELLRNVLAQFGLGEIETVTGAAGGVRYLPGIAPLETLETVRGACNRLRDTTRVLPGGYLYVADIFGDPEILDTFGTVMAGQFFAKEPDFVLTVETRGIAFAMATARALGVPLAIARQGQKVYEGPQMTIQYVSGSTGELQTMSLARRTVRDRRRVLIIDDFMRAGGTVRGMMDLMHEFSIEVVGAGVMIRKASEVRLPVDVLALMVMEDISGDKGAFLRPAEWLEQAASS